MNVTITARHFTLKDDMKDYMTEKCQKLGRFSERIQEVEVVLGWEKQSRYAELKIHVPGAPLVLNESSEDLRKSFDQAIEKAERQLKRHEARSGEVRKDSHRSA
ncbi:MAG TPA: ribosome-associated translation inhibitor RaiA [Calditrichia bacterium]|nr:ribosome-associated translation inhibitor RaiA [Calditrichota bacterium]HQU72034.1 ribosome-associated translation inhibitor RaiA [Calditrichia bacterium]HQV34375.1 ribosome-associated translation inhibitor RaiA [Calditrichia bacterium]